MYNLTSFYNTDVVSFFGKRKEKKKKIHGKARYGALSLCVPYQYLHARQMIAYQFKFF